MKDLDMYRNSIKRIYSKYDFDIEEKLKCGNIIINDRLESYGRVFWNTKWLIELKSVALIKQESDKYHIPATIPINWYAILIHELGHFLHLRKASAKYKTFDNYYAWQDKCNKRFRKYKELIKTQVSEYASRNYREFIAEVFAGIIYSKRKFLPEIMRLYRIFGGVEFKHSKCNEMEKVA